MQTLVMQPWKMFVTPSHPTFLLPSLTRLLWNSSILLEPVAWILIVFRTNHAQFILKIRVSVPQDLRTHLHCLQSVGKLTFFTSLSLPAFPSCISAAFFMGSLKNSCPTTTHVALQYLHIPWAFPLCFMASPNHSPAFPQPIFSGDNKTLTARHWAPSSCQRMWERRQGLCRN